jgi:peptidoglycan/LPS O-acetylase OafA/YrhL
VFSRLLRMRPVLALGAWSYSIYMVHLFIIAVANRGQQFLLIRSGHTELLREADNLSGLRRIVLSPGAETLLSLATVAVVIVLASQTYRWIEQPGREWARRRARAAGAPDAERIAPTI